MNLEISVFNRGKKLTDLVNQTLVLGNSSLWVIDLLSVLLTFLKLLTLVGCVFVLVA